MVNDDIEAIIHRGEQRTAEMSSKYEGLSFDDLNNFKMDTTVQQWEGEDFRSGRKTAGFFLEPSKRERKSNYSIDGYYKETMRANSKPDKGPKLPRAPKSIVVQPHQFFPKRFIELQEQEQAAYRRSLNYQVPLREPGEGETVEMVEQERQAQQKIIDNAEPLTEEQVEEKESLQKEGFEHWSKRDFQQLVKAYEAHGKTASPELLAAEITGQEVDSVAEYVKAFWKLGPSLEDWDRITERIEEGESKRNRQIVLERLLHQKINSVRYPMQELDLNYPSTKGKIYSEEEDRYLLVRLAYYGLGADDVYERIKKDITEFPVFRFDWFFKSRTPTELSRRANTLLGMIAKEDEERGSERERERDAAYDEPHPEPPKKSKKRTIDEVQKSEKASRSSTPAGPAKKKKTVTTTKKQKKT